MSQVVPLLRLRGVAKKFGSVAALRGVGFDVERGRVHGLLGANGAGKSTLIKILSGAMQRSGGHIDWKGKPVSITNPRQANELGIATIHQHVPVVPELSVLENIFLSDEGWWRHSKRHLDQYGELCERIGYDLDPRALISELAIGQRQMVSILTALVSGAELIIMDEPTASLAADERELVYRVVRQLSQQENKAILFVSHFLDEVVSLTDQVTVLRDGVVVLDAQTRELNEAKIAEAIVGREVVALERAARQRPPLDAGRPLLETRDLLPARFSEPISLGVSGGEVLGVAGLLGSGRSELIHAIFGADPYAGGEVLLDGKALRRSPVASVKAGMALVPEDRMVQGLIPEFEIWRNTTLPALDPVSWLSLTPIRAKEIERGLQAISKLNIKADSPESLVTELSGGNAQKVTIGKWLFSDIRVFLLDEPTAGIDIGAKTDILKLVRTLAEAGMAVIIASSEFEELLAVCDRIIVLRDGKITAERNAADTSEHELVLLAGGESNPHHAQQPAGQLTG